MNLDFVQQVGRDHPDLLPANLGHTCYTHTTILIQRLRAAGHRAYLICKSPNEGQYTPPGFKLRTVTGLDGKPYQCSGVSHDAIFFDDRQFDTIGSANEHDRPIYRVPGSTDISFDPSSGPRILATAVWNEVPRALWRNNNPPLLDDGLPAIEPVPVPKPVPVPPAGHGPGREEMMNAGRWLDGFYRAPEGLQRQHGLIKFRDGDTTKPEPDYEGLGAWLFDVYWNARLAGKSVDQARAAVVAAIRLTDEWKARHPNG